MADFAYGYALTHINGTYALLDANRGFPGVQPLAYQVELNDEGGGTLTIVGPTAHAGDVIDANIALGQLSPVPGYTYSYVSEASSQGNDGFIVQDIQGAYFFVTNSPYTGDLIGGHNNLTLVPPVVGCFMAGTRIATPGGSAAVEDLAIGQLVTTVEGTASPVRWIGRQTVARLFARERLPIRIRAGALAESVPSRDLLLSPSHALVIDGVLAQAGALINGVSILRESDVPSSFTYYHIELDDHALILAENVPAETFVDNIEREVFDNWDEYLALYPQGRNVAEMELPRAKSHRQVPKALREKLLARGQALFGARVDSAA